nr:RNase P subunit p30 family protein [Candidatus Baldrarchaeota archaeon]
MKKYVDMHVSSSIFHSENQIDKILHIISELGYAIICISFNKGFNNFFEKIKRKSEDFGLEVYRRMDLLPKNVQELKAKLRQIRRKFEIISVRCIDKKICVAAARDRRVDTLNFPTLESLKNFTESTANLAAEGDTAIEICLKTFLNVRGIRRARLITESRKAAKIALKKGIKIVIDSGAENIFEMRGPQELCSLGYLLDLPEEYIDLTVSEIPFNIIKTNLSKLSASFVLPGVEIVDVEEKNWSKKRETDT